MAFSCFVPEWCYVGPINFFQFANILTYRYFTVQINTHTGYFMEVWINGQVIHTTFSRLITPLYSEPTMEMDLFNLSPQASSELNHLVSLRLTVFAQNSPKARYSICSLGNKNAMRCSATGARFLHFNPDKFTLSLPKSRCGDYFFASLQLTLNPSLGYAT